jgi:type I restriction enzyme R subunit
MFSTEDVAGALNDLKEEIPKLKACHTRVMEHFTGLDQSDMDACILSLEDEAHRQQFEIDFRKFTKQMDIVLPDPAANPFLADLKFLGKVAHGARNMFRDEQLRIAGVGEKVRKLIDEHIYATGVDPKIPPIPLLAKDFEQHIATHTSPRAKASNIEHAIRHHINVNIEEDPAYYQKLSERLKKIIQDCEDKWEEMVQVLMQFRSNIEDERKQGAAEVGLTETKYAFYNILTAEVGHAQDFTELDEPVHQEVIAVTEQLVDMIKDATSIVDFFNKQDEMKDMKRRIKRALLETSFDSPDLRRKVIDRFMELARVKFG